MKQSVVRRWAWVSLLLLALFSWFGAVVPSGALTFWLLLGVTSVLFCLFKLYRSLDWVEDVSDAMAGKLKSHILWFGPVGAIEVLLTLRNRTA